MSFLPDHVLSVCLLLMSPDEEIRSHCMEKSLKILYEYVKKRGGRGQKKRCKYNCIKANPVSLKILWFVSYLWNSLCRKIRISGHIKYYFTYFIFPDPKKYNLSILWYFIYGISTIRYFQAESLTVESQESHIFIKPNGSLLFQWPRGTLRELMYCGVCVIY